MFLSLPKRNHYESNFNLYFSTTQIIKTHLKNSRYMPPCEHAVLVLFWLNCTGLLQITFCLFQCYI